MLLSCLTVRCIQVTGQTGKWQVWQSYKGNQITWNGMQETRKFWTRCFSAACNISNITMNFNESAQFSIVVAMSVCIFVVPNQCVLFLSLSLAKLVTWASKASHCPYPPTSSPPTLSRSPHSRCQKVPKIDKGAKNIQHSTKKYQKLWEKKVTKRAKMFYLSEEKKLSNVLKDKKKAKNWVFHCIGDTICTL